MQEPLQLTRAGISEAQVVLALQTPSTQRSPPATSHTTPQPPQLFASLASSTHVLPHEVRPGRQAHALEMHA